MRDLLPLPLHLRYNDNPPPEIKSFRDHLPNPGQTFLRDLLTNQKTEKNNMGWYACYTPLIPNASLFKATINTMQTLAIVPTHTYVFLFIVYMRH